MTTHDSNTTSVNGASSEAAPHAWRWGIFFLGAQALLLLVAVANAQETTSSTGALVPDSAPAPAEVASPSAEAAPVEPDDAKTGIVFTTSSATPSSAAAAASPSANSPVPPAPCEVRDDDDAEGFGSFLIGAGVFDLSSLNHRLAANGYEQVKGAMTVIGGEGHAVLRNGFVIGGRGAAILGPSGDGPSGTRTHFNGGFGLFDVGFALVHTRTVLFTVLGGIGGYGLSFDIGEDAGATFDAVLKNPKRGVSLSHGGFLTSLGLGMDGRVPLGKPERGHEGFFSLGARIGGLYGPSLGEWGLPQGADATGGPDAALAGLYAMLAIGFGGAPAELGPSN